MANKTLIEVIQQLIDVNSDLISKKIDVETAKQIAQNTQVIINAAKVQIEFIKITGSKRNDFFESAKLFTDDDNGQKQIESHEVIEESPAKNDESIINNGVVVPLSIMCKKHDKKQHREKNSTKNSGKSCDKCINYDKCLITPKCSLDDYTYFIKKQ